MPDNQKIVIAITGASGSLYARSLLGKLVLLKEQWEAVSVIMTGNAREVWKTELGDESFRDYDLPFFSQTDFSAPFASGSGRYGTMIIIPCSMGTLGRIAGGISSDL
ncbi:MAG: flavoprotein, partial [Bacteroidota bacterium]|nr:flavoprotein [Bacteroidota bacterium]